MPGHSALPVTVTCMWMRRRWKNLLLSIEEVHNQRRGAAVRLEIDEQVDQEVLANLLKSIQLSEADVVKINGPINLYRLMSLPDLVDQADLKFTPFERGCQLCTIATR